ncbi:hypothetical protein DRO97_01790 [Archaeoglobales archaeon]|nr:MAG: hypothetical protein DRO97_01790 [Archaeoglobales archaeon]
MAKLVDDWKPRILYELMKHDAPRKELYKLIGANSLGAITRALNILINNSMILETPCTKDKPFCKECVEYQKTEKKVGRPRKDRPVKRGPKATCLSINHEKIFEILDEYLNILKSIRRIKIEELPLFDDFDNTIKKSIVEYLNMAKRELVELINDIEK